jgi:hypothetical protein
VSATLCCRFHPESINEYFTSFYTGVAKKRRNTRFQYTSGEVFRFYGSLKVNT